MKKQMYFAIFSLACLSCVLLSLAMQGCASSSYAMPTGEQLKILGVVEANADTKSINKGRALAMTKCMGCHRQYWPKRYSSHRWPKLAKDMGRRASLTSSQIEDLSAYLVAASKADSVPQPE